MRNENEEEIRDNLKLFYVSEIIFFVFNLLPYLLTTDVVLIAHSLLNMIHHVCSDI